MKRSIFIIYSTFMSIIASLINDYFTNQINWEILNPQSILFFDAYYYWQQGAIYSNLSLFSFNYDLLLEISPTKNSIGVVYINSILYGLGFTIKEIPLLMGFLYSICCLYNFKRIDASIGLIFTSLLPINYLCSKESLIFIGLIFCTGWIIDKRIWKLILGLSIIFLARNELFYIILIAFFIQQIKIKKIGLFFLILGMWFYFKDQSLLSERLLGENNSLIFQGSLDYVMVSSGLPDVIIILSRIAVSFLIPFKWLISLPSLINYDNPVGLLVDATSFITLFYSIYIWHRIKKSNIKAESFSIKVVQYSAFIYIVIYLVIIFNQPTRPLLFSITAFLFVYSTYLKNYNFNK